MKLEIRCPKCGQFEKFDDMIPSQGNKVFACRDCAYKEDSSSVARENMLSHLRPESPIAEAQEKADGFTKEAGFRTRDSFNAGATRARRRKKC